MSSSPVRVFLFTDDGAVFEDVDDEIARRGGDGADGGGAGKLDGVVALLLGEGGGDEEENQEQQEDVDHVGDIDRKGFVRRFVADTHGLPRLVRVQGPGFKG